MAGPNEQQGQLEDYVSVKAPDGNTYRFPSSMSGEEINTILTDTLSTPKVEDRSMMQVLAGGQNIGDEGIETQSYGDGSGYEFTPEQRQTVEGLRNYTPQSAVGTRQNPYVFGGQRGEDGETVYPERAPVDSFFIGPDGTIQRQEPEKNQLLGFTTGTRRAVNNIGANLGVPFFEDARQEDNAMLARARASGVEPGIVGDLVGTGIGTWPLVAATRNPWVAGGVGGGANTDAPVGDYKEMLKDTAIGTAAGGILDKAVKGLGAIIAPRNRPGVNDMLERGVELTPGQIRGGALQKIEDAATSIPFIGDIIKSGQSRAMDTYNRAAINEVMTPMNAARGQARTRATEQATEALPEPQAPAPTQGGTFGHPQIQQPTPARQLANVDRKAIDDALGDIKLPDEVETGSRAVEWAYSQIGRQYDEVLPQLKIDMDGVAQNELLDLLSNAEALPGNYGEVLEATVMNNIVPRFSGPAATGRNWKEADSILGQEIREYGRSLDPDQRKYAAALRDVQSSLRDMVARNNPEQSELLRGIDRSYGRLLRVEHAAANSNAGVFTPEKLKTGVRTLDSTARKRATAQGGAEMQDFAEAGLDTLSKTVPDSGTATRGLIGTGMLAGVTSNVPAIAPNPAILAAIGMGLLPYTGRTPQRWAARAMGVRPRGAEALRTRTEAAGRPAVQAGVGPAVGVADNQDNVPTLRGRQEYVPDRMRD